MKNPKISVIVPVYKVEKYLDKCIESIVNQTYQNLEILLVDDGSPDNCPQMCDKWAQQDSRIRVIHQKNGGLADARNAGLNIITGDYITFVDSDDWIDSDMMECLKNNLEENGADIACIDFYFEYLDKDTLRCATTPFVSESKQIAADYILDKIRPEVCGKIYKADLIKNHRFNIENKYGEDLPFNYAVIKNAKKFINLGVCKYHYLQNSGNSLTTPYITDARAKSYIITKEIVKDTEDTDLYSIAVWRHIRNTYAILSRVVNGNDYFLRTYFDEIKHEILFYKNKIFFDKRYSIKQKIGTALLMISPKLFIHYIKSK